MTTRITKIADGIMEAAWLAAIILAPIFFNKYSSRIFEPDKSTLIRSLALLIAAVWAIKLIDTGLGYIRENPKSWFQQLVQTPLILPSLVVITTYLLSTILSVSPRISFWGSYQRMQGFYTTLSYFIIFAAIVANLRKPSQVRRIITTAIIASLPVSLYGVLQHYGIDPIPWGGNVTKRIAANMGNSIFVAAFLIMVVPLTIGRIVESFEAILKEETNVLRHIARSTVYIFIVSLQFIAIYFSRSRGPFLGLIVGGFFIFLLLSLHWRKRWLTFSTIVITGLIGVFLLVVNIPGGPLASIREAPWLGRLGQVFDMEQRTSQVRSLIWEGAAEMVAPHDPLTYPDGDTDTFNLIRPLVGYGPETMHMAYNPFYPPELAHVEKRNASPDRSHNETWDTLVITGGVGLIAYLFIFGSIFYYGLRWIGLIVNRRETIFFISLFLGGGVIGAITLSILLGINFIGVGLPAGVIAGILAYLTLAALTPREDVTKQLTGSQAVILIVLISAIMAHFVEINFGIAIVSTRTYFWVFAALLLVEGYLLPKEGIITVRSSKEVKSSSRSDKTARSSRRRSRQQRDPQFSDNPWLLSSIIGALLSAIILLPLIFEFISSQANSTAFNILWSSLTTVRSGSTSYGVLALTITAWLASAILYISEDSKISGTGTWLKSVGVVLGLSLLISFIYSLVLSGTLSSLGKFTPQSINDVILQSRSFEGLLTQFYFFTFLGVFVMGMILSIQDSSKMNASKDIAWILSPIILVIAFWLISVTNLRIIRADISFKMAEPFAANNQWPVAIELYKRASDLAPDEDYYYLFLGRGYLEQAKLLESEEEQAVIFQQAESDLIRAQNINPLNPDHTANLGRLNSWWALQAENEEVRKARGEDSIEYYQAVLQLSPNNARLWNEWSIVDINVMGDYDSALEKLETSLAIDPTYDWTHAILGDYYTQIAQQSAEENQSKTTLEKAISYYQNAIEYADNATLKSSQGLNYFFALASVYQAAEDITNTIAILETSLEYAKNQTDIWRIHENLTQLYIQQEDYANALVNAQSALAVAPESETERLENLINQLVNNR